MNTALQCRPARLRRPLRTSHLFAGSLLAGALLLAAGSPAVSQTRVPWYQPFDASSLWNTPIGDGAIFSGPLGIGFNGDFADIDIEYELRGLPTDPNTNTNTYANSILFPYYALPNKGVGLYPNGTTSLFFYKPDAGSYVFWQWQYWSRAGFGADLTNVSNFQFGTFGVFNNIRPDSGGDESAFGTHGGSELSSVGGDLRLGEATSPDPIRHALKLNIDGHYLYPGVPHTVNSDRAGNGYRWPALKADSDPPPYSGSNPDLAQGSLLAIPSSVNLNNLGLQTAVGRKIGWTLQNFGCYIVDNSGYTGDQLCIEQNVRQEINQNYGDADYLAGSVSADLILLYQQLRVVTNNGSSNVGGGGNRLTSQAGGLGPVNNIPDGDYYIRNRTSGEYLNVWGGDTAPGTEVHQYYYQDGAGNEIFTLSHVGAGYYTLKGKDSGLLVTVVNTSFDAGAHLIIAGTGTLPSGASGPADNQLWSFLPVDVSNGDYLMQVRHSDLVLDVPGSTSDTVPLQQWPCNNTGAQRWSLVPVGGTAAPALLSGTAIGTTGSWNNTGNDRTKALDGSMTTFFDAPSANGAWVGMDLGSGKTKKITKIRFCPRSGWASRMTGGTFQGSNNLTSWTTLATISSAPAASGWTQTTSIASTTKFRYVRYLSPNGSYGNVSELQFYGQ